MDVKKIKQRNVIQDSDQGWALVIAVMNHLVPVKGEFLHHMGDCQLLKKDTLPLSYIELTS